MKKKRKASKYSISSYEPELSYKREFDPSEGTTVKIKKYFTPVGARAAVVRRQGFSQTLRKYEGKASMLKAISILMGNDREQGSKHFYFSSDPFALSIMITDLTNKPASQIFYENAFKKFSKNKLMHWVSDKKGITVAQARLTMSALDWSNFGQFINDEIINNTCLGKFYKEGIENAVETGTDRIELYTGPYAENFNSNKEKAIQSFTKAANLANELKLGINAGHDLNLDNLNYFKNNINGLLEVSIGHALICDSLYSRI